MKVLFSERLGDVVAKIDREDISLQDLFPFLKTYVENRPDIHISYKMLVADTLSSHYAVECTLQMDNGISIVRVGEVCDMTDESPVKTVYERAMIKTVYDFLKVKFRDPEQTGDHTAQETRVTQEVHKAPEQPKQVLSDDTVLLIGNMKSQRFGNVKNTPQFKHFLEQLVSATGLQFPDDARSKQLSALLAYAKEVL